MRARDLAGAALLLALAACPPPSTWGGGSASPASGGSASGGAIDPDACGPLEGDAGRRLHAFLVAAATLERASTAAEADARAACDDLARALALPAADDGLATCDRVADALVRGPHLAITAAPLACRADATAAVAVATACEGAAGAAAGYVARCHGACAGACVGPCDGTCASGDNATCRAACTGECKGACTGGCDGAITIDGPGQPPTIACEAAAELTGASAFACAPAALAVARTDAAADALAGALERDLPRLRATAGALGGAARALAHWQGEQDALSAAAGDLVLGLGRQAPCASGQLASGTSASSAIQARLERIDAASHRVLAAAHVE